MQIEKPRNEVDSRLIFVKFVFSLTPLLILLGCVSSSPKNEKLELYNDVLNQVMNDRYCHYCSEPSDFIKKEYDRLISGKIDTIDYFTKLDSLKSISEEPRKCLLEYSEGLHKFYVEDGKVDMAMKSSIQKSLQAPFIKEHFDPEIILAITDTLSLKASLRSNDLMGDCMEITPYVRNPDNPYKNGMGVLGFSKIYFNKEINKAIVYYEFMCGRSCGRGEVLFVERTNSRWKIVEYKRIWDS